MNPTGFKRSPGTGLFAGAPFSVPEIPCRSVRLAPSLEGTGIEIIHVGCNHRPLVILKDFGVRCYQTRERADSIASSKSRGFIFGVIWRGEFLRCFQEFILRNRSSWWVRGAPRGWGRSAAPHRRRRRTPPTQTWAAAPTPSSPCEWGGGGVWLGGERFGGGMGPTDPGRWPLSIGRLADSFRVRNEAPIFPV